MLFKVWNQGEEDGGYEYLPCIFGEEIRIKKLSRVFVFFGREIR